jgi:hypothetical protein
MSAQSFAKQLKEIIKGVQAKGTAAIYCDALISYLEEVEKSQDPELTPVELEQFKADLQNWINQNDFQHQSKLEMFRSVITAGQSAIKSSFLLNGGAAVALLAFIGHLASIDKANVAIFAPSLLPFAYGVLAIAITSGFTYLSQWLYASEYQPARKTGFVFNIICIILGLSSYGFFLWGLFSTYNALTIYA